jgi:hypothetical protein
MGEARRDVGPKMLIDREVIDSEDLDGEQRQ